MINAKNIILIALPLSLFADNLEQLLELSKNNKLLKSSQLLTKSVMMEYESSKSSYLPSFDLAASVQNATKEMASTPTNSARGSVNLNYTIYDGGKKQSLFKSYEQAVKSSQSSQEDLQNQISLQVTTYYYTYLGLIASKEAKLKQIEQLSSDYDRLQKFYSVGSATNDEVQKILSTLENAKVELSEIELNLETILHELQYTVGKKVAIDEGSKIEYTTLKEQIERADIKALEHSIQKALFDTDSVKSYKYPTISFSDTLSRSYLDYDESIYQSYEDNYNQNIASLNLSWNVFDFGSRDEAYQASYTSYLALKEQYEYEKEKASIDLKLSLKAYDIAKQKIASASSALRAADATYEMVYKKFQNGLVDNVAYLQALSEKYTSESGLKNAIYDLEIKKATVLYNSGKNIEEYVK
jgi:outer membrane protein TolC